MIQTLEAVLEGALQRLSEQITTFLPPLLAGMAILLVAVFFAIFARWLLTKIFKGIAFDRFLRQSGISSLLDRSGHLRATRLVAGTAYWAILLAGLLTALSAFNTELTSRMVEAAVLLFPKIVTAGLIVVAGVWLGQYLGRSTLVWACNEGLPGPRTLGGVVRALVVFVAIVVAADHLDFARTVFLAAFLMLMGGVVLAVSLALGVGGGEAVRRYITRRTSEQEERTEKSLWNHL